MENGKTTRYVFYLIAYVVSFTFALMIFATGQTKYEDLSAHWMKLSMSMEDCAQ